MSTLNDLIATSLQNLGYSGSVNDMLYAFYRDNNAMSERQWLFDQIGLNASVNDLKFAYLVSLGYAGALNDMFRKALIDGTYFIEPSGIWILTDGTWSDAGQWEDANTWNDGV